MPQPTRSDVHIDQALSNISIAYMQSPGMFIADQVFPNVPVTKASDKYFTYTKSDWRRDTAKPRAPGTESAGTGWNVSTDNYSAEVYALHHDIYDQIRRNTDAVIDLEGETTKFLMQQMMIQKEVAWASTFFTTGVWGTDVVGSTDFTKWDDSASDPEADMDTAKAAILKSNGIEPNTLVVSYEVHQALKKHPLIMERFKYTSADSITAAMIARYLEVDRYLVSKASYDTSNEGAAAESNAFVMGKNALLCHVTQTPGLLVPTAGYTFGWTGLNPAGANVATKMFRMEHLEADRVENQFAYDQKVVASGLGYFFSAAVS